MNLIKQVEEANNILKDTSINAVIIQTDEYFTDCDEDDKYYGEPMYEGYLEDEFEEELNNTITGRYCDIGSVREELEGYASEYIENNI